MTQLDRHTSGDKGIAVRHHYTGIPVIDRPPGFGAVVATDSTFFADRARLYGIRLVMLVELIAELAIGVRRTPRPNYALYTVVRRGDGHVVERQIVELPNHGGWNATWTSASDTLARAVWEQATSLAYFNGEDEDEVMSIGPEADAFSVAFNVEKPFAVTWRGVAHIYYRTAENMPPEHWICSALVRGNLYDSLRMMSDRYVTRMVAKADAEDLAYDLARQDPEPRT